MASWLSEDLLLYCRGPCQPQKYTFELKWQKKAVHRNSRDPCFCIWVIYCLMFHDGNTWAHPPLQATCWRACSGQRERSFSVHSVFVYVHVTAQSFIGMCWCFFQTAVYTLYIASLHCNSSECEWVCTSTEWQHIGPTSDCSNRDIRPDNRAGGTDNHPLR